MSDDCAYAINYDNGTYHMYIAVTISIATHTIIVDFKNSNFPSTYYPRLINLKKILSFNQ